MIAVLMSTYNGEQYLKEQIDSILNQTYPDFVLFIRDDGSSDETQKIISSYEDKRIRFESGKNLGPARSFFALLNSVPEAEYIFFSDQDDVWYPEKIEKMLAEIKKYDGCPAMVFSDFEMIDSDGRLLSDSYSKHAALQVCEGLVQINKIIPQPYVFGCASVINRCLADKVLAPPDGIEMHDCWISLVASAIGKLAYMPQTTIAHRFHSNNATGKSGQDSVLSKLTRATKGLKKQIANTELRLNQVDLLLKEFDKDLNNESKEMLEAVYDAKFKGKWKTVKTLKKHGFSRQKSLNTCFFYFTVLANRKKR